MLRIVRPVLLITCLLHGALFADNLLHLGTPVLDRPTLTALGVQLPITGDDNFNSGVTVRYRVSGSTSWKTGLPLFRVHPETVANWTVSPQFAGSIFDLKPATSYEIELHASDPDGLDQVMTLSAVTRDAPKDPVAPLVRNVTDSSSFQSALNSAQPGDVITLANGIYNGAFSISRAGTPANPIVIRGQSQDGAVLDGGNCADCNVFEVYGAGYVHLERLTIRNALRAIRFQTSGATSNVVRRVHVQNTTLGIGGRAPQTDFYIADNILEGRLVWPQIYTDDAGLHSDDTGIAVFGSGHVVAHNRIGGYGDAMRTGQDGARANDFYGNEILYSYDNGLELDGSEGNVRSLRNRFMNTFMPLSVQPVRGGPDYILRNVSINVVEEQIKFHALGTVPPSEPSGVLAYHNTFLSASNLALQVQTSATSHYFELGNNLFIARGSSGQRVVDWTGPIDHATFDYNGYFPDGSFRFAIPTLVTAPSFSALQAIGLEQHGLIVNGPIFANGMTAPASYLPLIAPVDASLAAGSIAIDKARLLPNVNDAFQGSAPDLGALESGCPIPSYGPRPEGTDESNEVISCNTDSAVTGVTVSPAAVQLAASQSQQFTASTTPPGEPVIWQLSQQRGILSAAGLYTAPADALLGEQITVKAQSVTSPNVAGSGLISLVAPVSVSLMPSSATLYKGGTRQFTATVSGAVDKNVHWALSPSVGSITSGGLYAAPATISISQNVQVTAISDADPNKFATAVVTLLPDPVILVTVSPATVTLTKRGKQQFQASVTGATNSAVTWSINPAIGMISQTGLYTAPNNVNRSVSITVYAKSVQDPTATGTATIALSK